MSKPLSLPKTWILIRGLTRSSYHWLDFPEKLKQRLQLEMVPTPELPGNGYLHDSVSPTDMPSAISILQKNSIQLAADDKLFANQPIGLIGLSLGGMIAANWAYSNPEVISHLVIVNSSFSFLSPFYKRLKPQNYVSIIKNILSNDASAIEKFILQTTSNDEKKWQPVLEPLIEFQRQHPLHIQNFARQLLLARQTQKLNKPKAKTLILSSLNDRLVDSSCSRLLADFWNVPNDVHPTAGHDLPLDDADWIIEKIQSRFLI